MDADRAPASGASDQWWIGQFGAAPSPPRDARARVNLGGHARTILRSVFNRRADKWENSSTEWPTRQTRCPSMGTIRRERSRRVRRRWGAILGCAEQRSTVCCDKPHAGPARSYYVLPTTPVRPADSTNPPPIAATFRAFPLPERHRRFFIGPRATRADATRIAARYARGRYARLGRLTKPAPNYSCSEHTAPAAPANAERPSLLSWLVPGALKCVLSRLSNRTLRSDHTASRLQEVYTTPGGQ